jgi:RNA-directed DNA polymerase
MQKEFSHIHFERYADDIVVHCRSHQQLEFIERKIRARFAQCKLELCPEKTKIVYCKDSNRNGLYPNQSFDFLGYTFRPRSSRNREGKFFVSFAPAVSRHSLKGMRQKIKEHPLIKGNFSLSIDELAMIINSIIQGWINYYGRFNKSAMSAIYDYINSKLMKRARRKFKHLQRRKRRSGLWLRELYKQTPSLFAHWRVWSWVAE